MFSGNLPRLIFPIIDSSDINKYLKIKDFYPELNSLSIKINKENPLLLKLVETICKSSYPQGDINKIKIVLIHLFHFMQYFNGEEKLFFPKIETRKFDEYRNQFNELRLDRLKRCIRNENKLLLDMILFFKNKYYKDANSQKLDITIFIVLDVIQYSYDGL